MTVSSMIDNFLIEYDRVISLSAPSYEDSEIISFLDRAQFDLLDRIHANKNYELAGSLFDTVTYSSPLSGAVSGYENEVRVDLTSGTTRYLYYIGSRSKLTRTQVPVVSSGKIVRNEEIVEMTTVQYEASVLNAAIYRQPKCFIQGTDLVVLFDYYTTISDVYVDYLKRPKFLSTSTDDSSNTTTCELRDDLHEEVVTLAVGYGKEAAERVLQQTEKE